MVGAVNSDIVGDGDTDDNANTGDDIVHSFLYSHLDFTNNFVSTMNP